MVEDCVIPCYNHSPGGEYNTESLIFKMAAARFLDVSGEGTRKRKETAVALIYTETIILLRLSEYCRIIPSTTSRGFDNIFTSR